MSSNGTTLRDCQEKHEGNQVAKEERAPKSAAEDSKVTPMIAQFLEIKAQYPHALLFYRMGDFYELFFDDAIEAASALDITLTKRGQHQGKPVPMCGVPLHTSKAYLSRLTNKGYKVAVCEQQENPAEAKKRGSKSVVKRNVVRLHTSGTATDDEALDSRSNNYLLALAEVSGGLALAWLDISTGDFFTQDISERIAKSSVGSALIAAVACLAPKEILIPEKLLNREEFRDFCKDWKVQLTPLSNSHFDSESGKCYLQKVFDVLALDAFGDFGRAELAAAGAVLNYVELTQKGKFPYIAPLRQLSSSDFMEIDAATRRNLELIEALNGGRKGSLLACIDRTVTGTGARLLCSRVANPLTDPTAIVDRLDMVSWFLNDASRTEDIIASLKGCPDMERSLTRLSLGRGGPRDLAVLGKSLREAIRLKGLLRTVDAPLPRGLSALESALDDQGPIVEELERALLPELPLQARDGGFIAKGYAPHLDEYRTLRDESRRLIAALQNRYVLETGVNALKIKHNNILGYFIEVSSTNASKIDISPGSDFIHRQTLASAMRFTTVELSELEQKISGAAQKAIAVELELYDQLLKRVLQQARGIAQTAKALAELDVATALAILAQEQRWCRPCLDHSLDFLVEGGRHPVVEAALVRDNDGPFVANNCDLSPERRLWLITGPNMAGKSTFLRQNALIAVLAQMGSYVPARKARIGVIDRLFSRVGAADDLARGRSTFMVEMVETAVILNQATERSLVILDEIGRGTATYDGLSIAWACVEHLHENNQSRALFATHYHEITSLTSKLPSLSCHSMRVKEWENQVIFLHEVSRGTADRSYGIHVARLAGLPTVAIVRAEQVLQSLQEDGQSDKISRLSDDLPLFSTLKTAPFSQEESLPQESKAVMEKLDEIQPDNLNPRQALEFLYELKALRSR